MDRGAMSVPLIVFLTRTREEFMFVGVDVLVQESLSITVSGIDMGPKQSAFLVQSNSLDALPKMVEQGMKFDVVLLDGDHNYYTVAKELTYLEALTRPSGIVLVDDYHGRWSDRDLWYAERPGYEDVKDVSKRVDTEKHGVKPAVDEFLEKNPNWCSEVLVAGEPILLRHR